MKNEKVARKIIIPLLFPIVFLSACQNVAGSKESRKIVANIADNYPAVFDNAAASLALVERHESQHWTADIPYLVSYPLKWKFVFLKYVVSEDLYHNLEKGKVILLPFGLSLSKTNSGARPKQLFRDKHYNMPSYNPYSSENVEDQSTEVYRTIDKEIARYYFTSYSNFLVYLKNYQPANNETILSDLDLHNLDTSEVDLTELKKDVDYVASPTYLDRDLDALPFNSYNNGKLEMTRFYINFYHEGLTECPIFYNRYKLAMECFLDEVDTFETVKNRLSAQ